MNKITTFILGAIVGASINYCSEHYTPPKRTMAHWYDKGVAVQIHNDTTKHQQKPDWTNYVIGTPNGKITPTPENTYFSNNLETGFWQSKKTFTEILEEDGHRKEHGQPRPFRAIMRNDTLYTIDPDSIYVGFDGIGGYAKMGKKN